MDVVGAAVVARVDVAVRLALAAVVDVLDAVEDVPEGLAAEVEVEAVGLGERVVATAVLTAVREPAVIDETAPAVVGLLVTVVVCVSAAADTVSANVVPTDANPAAPTSPAVRILTLRRMRTPACPASGELITMFPFGPWFRGSFERARAISDGSRRPVQFNVDRSGCALAVGFLGPRFTFTQDFLSANPLELPVVGPTGMRRTCARTPFRSPVWSPFSRRPLSITMTSYSLVRARWRPIWPSAAWSTR